VHGQVDENVDPVLAHEPGDLLVGEAGDVAPDVGVRTEPRGDPVRTSDIGIAKDLEVFVIMCREQSRREKRLGMVAEVRRNIADAKPAPGRAVVPMRLGDGCLWLGEPAAPQPMLFGNRPRIVTGTEDERVEQVV
jgi:hypothetical protein